MYWEKYCNSKELVFFVYIDNGSAEPDILTAYVPGESGGCYSMFALWQRYRTLKK